ncbi:phage major capsid protein [Tomitella gaofuii]|uniref:phage major capsid protein n=1 Tax=Tomitella gaofuii TaxID=2760083 RepID=UPI0015FE39AA|nr:phage major capsid protein [Tomitella gaofuii]
MAKTILEKRSAAVAEAQSIVESVKSAGDLDEGQSARLGELHTEIKGFDEHIARAKSDAAIVEQIKSMGKVEHEGTPRGGHAEVHAKTIGEHFIKSVGDRIASRDGGRFSVQGPEWTGAKAATDPQLTGGGDGAYADWLVDVDTNIQREKRERLVIADLLGTGTISGSSIKYFVEGDFEGDFETVGEGKKKPQVHVGDPTPVVDALTKIAAWVHLSDETLEDLPFLVSEINNRLIYKLGVEEEKQLLSGNGTGTNLLGLLNRSGVQSETADAAEDNADAIFRATTKIQNATDLTADGIVIHPLDYQEFRLSRDANGRYFGGGYFEGNAQPPLWGLSTVVSPVVERGKPLVGNFRQSSTLYRKGGLRIDTTNTDGDDFINNMVKTRVEERVALAVRQPLALVKVALTV